MKKFILQEVETEGKTTLVLLPTRSKMRRQMFNEIRKFQQTGKMSAFLRNLFVEVKANVVSQ